MTIRVAINGFGRIGRMVLRALLETQRGSITVVAINDLADPKTNAHLFKYDSVHGPFPGTVQAEGDTLTIGPPTPGYKIALFSQKDPATLPWESLNVDVVLECSGHFTSYEKASAHLTAGAEKVLISAPAQGADLTVVFGVNHALIRPDHRIISCGSCTTNCLAPVAAVLEQSVGIERGYMTTIHAYTGDQRLVDTGHGDWRRARAAGLSIIPTSTGAASALGLVLPSLQGKLDGAAFRVPTPNVSVIDFTFVPARPTTVDEINELMIQAAASSLDGVLSVVDVPLVSTDFNHSPYSCHFDTTQTQVVGSYLGRVVAWYDNEWGFANRMIDVTTHMVKMG